MTKTVQDWSGVRSPSRALRRLRQGKRKHFIPSRTVPMDDVYQLGNTLVMHPDRWEQMSAHLERMNGR
ncbi:hypothetical protein [Azorhizobium caulinodans]|uniref:hypothetical protein n=1 Tax=Azorhizobium caulinodans TaxID=7 RepID=UPI002FBDD7A6